MKIIRSIYLILLNVELERFPLFSPTKGLLHVRDAEVVIAPASRRAHQMVGMSAAGARASPHWTPHAQANAKSNPAQLSTLRAAHFAALQEWEPSAHPGPLEYAVSSALGHGPKPPGFGRSGSRQRPEPRVREHPTGRTIGPGTYDRIGFGTFSRYEATRQEQWRTDRPTARKVSHSHPQGRPTSTRARDDLGDPPHKAPPGPGEYNLERYSQVRSPTHPPTHPLSTRAPNLSLEPP